MISAHEAAETILPAYDIPEEERKFIDDVVATNLAHDMVRIARVEAAFVISGLLGWKLRLLAHKHNRTPSDYLLKYIITYDVTKMFQQRLDAAYADLLAAVRAKAAAETNDSPADRGAADATDAAAPPADEIPFGGSFVAPPFSERRPPDLMLARPRRGISGDNGDHPPLKLIDPPHPDPEPQTAPDDDGAAVAPDGP